MNLVTIAQLQNQVFEIERLRIKIVDKNPTSLCLPYPFKKRISSKLTVHEFLKKRIEPLIEGSAIEVYHAACKGPVPHFYRLQELFVTEC